MSLVSVIIPTHNRSQIVRRAVQSVLDQDHQDLQVIVVDDASTDDTPDSIKSIADDRVIYIQHVQNRGPSGARNTGIGAADGDYISFLDSDDTWTKNKLQKQVAALNVAQHADYAYCGWLWVSTDTGKVVRSRVPDPQSGLIQGKCRWMYNMVQDLVVRRDLAQRVRFSEDLHSYENLDWLMRLGVDGKHVYVPEPLVTCYQHPGDRVSDDDPAKIAALSRILKEQGDVIQRHRTFEHQLTLALGTLCAKHASPNAGTLLRHAVRLSPTSLRSWFNLARTVPGLAAVVRTVRP